MKKHIKVITGHSLEEWKSKYAKQIEKSKLEVVEDKEDLISYSKYWEIDGKFYRVPSVFEWYNISLRKSVFLTSLATVSCILATFFLVAALIQSQVKWKADKYGLSISLYAQDGTFEDGSKSKVISGINKGTKLKDVSGIEKCTPILKDHLFKHWHVDNGNEGAVIEFDENTEINSNTSLKAYYELKPADPVNFGTYTIDGAIVAQDSWETVFAVINQGKAKFIEAYCKDQPSYSTNKDQALLEFMDSKCNWRIISVGSVGDYGVRIIGVGQDQLYTPANSSNDVNELGREIFTFEFNECVMPLPYSYYQGGSPFYTKEGSQDPEEPLQYCGLKTYTEDIIFNQLPQIVKENVKTVSKRTLQVREGFKIVLNETFQQWELDRRCLNGTYEDEDGNKYPNNKLEIVETPEKLFSLSLDEIGATKIPFTYTDGQKDEDGIEIKKQGTDLMKEATHYNKGLMDEVGIKVGEGFYDEETDDYTGEYQFYGHEWYDPSQHTDPVKRAKRYFVGNGEVSIKTQYRTRSIYIPNEKDASDNAKKRSSGNIEYSCFETWNISENGDFGGWTTSGLLDPDDNTRRLKFFRGDMAWASIFVAPAFCI